MTVLSDTEVVRRLFDARARGDLRRLVALMDPDVVAQALCGGAVVRGASSVRRAIVQEADRGRRIEIDPHRFEAQGDGSVLVFGRVRVIDGGQLADSPAAWRFTVRRERVVRIVPLGAEARLRRVA